MTFSFQTCQLFGILKISFRLYVFKLGMLINMTTPSSSPLLRHLLMSNRSLDEPPAKRRCRDSNVEMFEQLMAFITSLLLSNEGCVYHADINYCKYYDNFVEFMASGRAISIPDIYSSLTFRFGTADSESSIPPTVQVSKSELINCMLQRNVFGARCEDVLEMFNPYYFDNPDCHLTINMYKCITPDHEHHGLNDCVDNVVLNMWYHNSAIFNSRCIIERYLNNVLLYNTNNEVEMSIVRLVRVNNCPTVYTISLYKPTLGTVLGVVLDWANDQMKTFRKWAFEGMTLKDNKLVAYVQ